MATIPAAEVGRASSATRWTQLVLGIIGMVMIANYQYGWTLFVKPLEKQHHWGQAAIQVAFTLFVLAETWLVPMEGYLVDRFGPRLLVLIGGVLVGVAWVIDSAANTLPTLYLGGILAGVGAGIVYGTASGNALKWFTDRRGLAVGLTAAGFGAGAALTVIPIYHMIQTSGYQSAFLTFGILQGAIVMVTALFLRRPRPGEVPAATGGKVQQTARDFTPGEMVKTQHFWLLYVMFTMMAMGGLMVTAQIAPMAKDYKVADIPVSLLLTSGPALLVALGLDKITNGITRPLFGWISDHIGRENTMTIAFGLEGLSILLLITFAHNPLMFIVLTGLTFFAWGEIFSLFPSITGDLWGRKYATTNYGLLYTAKGTAALLIPIGSLLKAATGSWVPILALGVAFDLGAAVLAQFCLKPMRLRWFAAQTPAAAVAMSASQ